MNTIGNAFCAGGLGFFMMVGGAIAHYGWRDAIGNLPQNATLPFIFAVGCLFVAALIGATRP